MPETVPTIASRPQKESYAARRARRSCGVCADDMDLFAQMRHEIDREANEKSNQPTVPKIPTTVALPTPTTTTAATSSSTTSPSLPTPLPCPPDSESLGRATWTFLHTMSAYYPDQPSKGQQQRMAAFINNFASFYPCPPCAEHLQKHLEKNQPPTQNRSLLSQFLCRYHNDVNVRLGKKTFDCTRYDERWRDGPKLDAGYDCIEEQPPSDSQ